MKNGVRRLIPLSLLLGIIIFPLSVCAEHVIGEVIANVVLWSSLNRLPANAPHSVVDLKPTLDDSTLSTIKPNNQLVPSFVVHSKIQNPFIYGTTLSPLDSNYSVIPASQTFEADARDYFHRRYPGTVIGIGNIEESARIQVILKTLDLVVRSEDTGQYIVGGKIALKVLINHNGRSMSKKLVTVAKTEGPALTAKAMDPLYGRTVDQLINKVILQLDAYLSSINL